MYKIKFNAGKSSVLFQDYGAVNWPVFRTLFFNVQSARYWSSTMWADGTGNHAWHVDFNYGIAHTYMYGADINEGNALQSWNNIYDIFLCHGVNDEREIKKRFKGKTFIMGYPRYDSFFSGEIDLSNIRREFDLAESKKRH